MRWIGINSGYKTRCWPYIRSILLWIGRGTRPVELRNWVNTQSPKKDILYLIDYEFLGQQLNGLDVICALGIENESVLVTSLFEEPNVLNQAKSISVKIIPKSMAVFVPFCIRSH